MKEPIRLLTLPILLLLITSSFAQVGPKDKWWFEEPYRIIQTNLREIDAIDFDVDVYINSLKDIGANAVLINVGGIVANYYTDLEYHFRNPNLKFDMIEAVIDRLHEEGIRVVGRFDFSKLNETLAAKRPEWLYKGVKGNHVNYNGQVHTCVNGGYQREYALKILDEALGRFPLDGVFFNMIGYWTRDYSGNYHGICQSDACRDRFAEWSGGLKTPIEEDLDDPAFRKYEKFKFETSSELYMSMYDVIKSHGDQIAIIYGTHAGTDFFRKESHSHANLFNGKVPWEYNAPHNVKSTIGSWKDKQASNTAVHFIAYPNRHTADASWNTQMRLVQNIMYGAGLDFYCIGRLDNLEDRAVLENVKTVYQFHKANEKYLHHTLSGNRVLMLHDRYSREEYRGIFEVLTENHILFDVMEHWCLNSDDVPRELDSYEVIVLPEIDRLSDEECARLDKYVDSGGKLLVTGFASTRDEIGNPLNRIRLESLGVKPEYKEFDKVEGTFFRIFEKDKDRLKSDVLKDLDLVYAWDKGLLCEPGEETEGMLGFIPPAMIGPPEKCYYTEVTEIPGLIYNEYGKGKTAFLPFRVGSLYHNTRHYGHAELVRCALAELLDFNGNLLTDASPLIEISRQVSPAGEFEWYGLLNHAGQLGNAFHEPFPVYDIKFKFLPEKKVKSVKSLQNGQRIHYIEKEGWVEVTIPELTSFDIVLVEY